MKPNHRGSIDCGGSAILIFQIHWMITTIILLTLSNQRHEAQGVYVCTHNNWISIKWRRKQKITHIWNMNVRVPFTLHSLKSEMRSEMVDLWRPVEITSTISSTDRGITLLARTTHWANGMIQFYILPIFAVYLSFYFQFNNRPIQGNHTTPLSR